jgi:DNA-binding NarL/FixJ family response regulator
MASDVREIRILTVDDHALLRKGIGTLISAEPDMKAASSA